MEMTDYWQVFPDEANAFLPTPLDEKRLALFKTLYNLVIEANKTMNLTRITNLEDFCHRHLLDSLTLVPYLKDYPGNFSLADIGSGAGFPALPLAIIFPAAHIVAVESVQKKAGFIEKTAAALGLENVSVLAERSEVLGQSNPTREQFDITTARAVSTLNVLVELCLPLVKKGGQVFAMKTLEAKGAELSQAQKAITTLGGQVNGWIDVSTPHLPSRCLIVIDKVRSTPRLYPRAPGTPKKTPL